MTEWLTLDRFRELADAYGGVVSRWPERHREAAWRMAFRPDAIAILEQASVLDEALDAWRSPAPAAALRDRVMSDRPALGKRLAVRLRLWWSGVGLAAALAGAAAGTAAVAMVAPIDATPESSTSFGDVAAQDG